MKAENVLLTHFSQRYPKIPILRSATAAALEASEPSDLVPSDATPTDQSSASPPTVEHEPVVAVAFDCASIPIGSMWKMSRYTPALERVFAEMAEAAEGEEGTEDAVVASELVAARKAAVSGSDSASIKSSDSKSQGKRSIEAQGEDDPSSGSMKKKRKGNKKGKQAKGDESAPLLV